MKEKKGRRLTRIGLAAFLMNGFEFLRAEGSRDADPRRADAGQGSLLGSFFAAGFGHAGLPW